MRSTGFPDSTLNAVAPLMRSSLNIRSASRIAATASGSLISSLLESHMIRSSPRRDMTRSIPTVCLLLLNTNIHYRAYSLLLHQPGTIWDNLSIACDLSVRQGLSNPITSIHVSGVHLVSILMYIRCQSKGPV